jgi:hypothetical protein
MSAYLDALVRDVRGEFLVAARARFIQHDESDAAFLEKHLDAVVGVPDLQVASLCFATLRRGTLLVVDPRFSRRPRDHLVETCWWPRANDENARVIAAASWLHASPQHRAVVVSHGPSCMDAVAVMVCIRLDICACRDTPPSSSSPTPLPADLLHAVLSALHGTDRRLAGHVCRAWRRAACDPLMPTTTADVAAWVGPCIVEMRQACWSFATTRCVVEVMWALTRHWLGGGM